MSRNQRGATRSNPSVHHQEKRIREESHNNPSFQNREWQGNGMQRQYMRGSGGPGRRRGSGAPRTGRGNGFTGCIDINERSDERRLREWQEQRKRKENDDKRLAPVSFEQLKIWAGTEDAGQLILSMLTERQQLEQFLKQREMDAECFSLLLKAAVCAITAQYQKESIKQLLEVLCKAEFLDRHLTKYTTDKQNHGWPWADASEFFTSVLSIMKQVLDKLPRFAYKCVIITTKLIHLASRDITEGLNEDERILNEDERILNKDERILNKDERILSSLKEMLTTAKEVYKAEEEKEVASKRGRLWNAGNMAAPPDNFMDLPVVPTVYDLREDARPFIRCAVTEGVYEDVNHYLDIQFRLMRHDFILPLQKGINEFIKSGFKKDFNCQDLRVYFNVHIVGTIFDEGLDHLLQFEVLKGIKWDSSKRLMFGSLLCLSKDNFETVVFATVARREASSLEKGSITVKFKSGLDVVFNSTSRDTYIMAETTAFFEMYKPVLEGLKEMAANLPLQDYIIKCKKELTPPKYLLYGGVTRPLPVYDISCLMKGFREVNVPVLTTTKWPPAEMMCLNESQRDAAILALTKELALIQGPPGTGKTYVGLKVMQILLTNQHVSGGNAEKNSDPVLVVCYTNHALDQFLEGILEFCQDGIVRVGGKSQSEKLAAFHINKLKQSARERMPKMNSSRQDCLKVLELVSQRIEGLNTIMNLLEVEISSEDYLQNVMRNGHYESLKRIDKSCEDKTPVIKQWLNSSNISVVTALNQMISDHLSKLIFDLTRVPGRLKVKKSMNIVERASLYQYWLLRYRKSVQRQIQSLPRSANLDQVRLESYLKITQTEIVSDRRLVQNIFPHSFVRHIDELADTLDHKEMVSSGGPVRYWLLGLNNKLHERLDEIQLLSRYLAGENITDTFDDAGSLKKEEEHRMIGRDAFSKKQYESQINQARSSIISVIDRAESLGITIENGSADSGEWKSSEKPLSFKDIQMRLRSIDAMTAEDEEEIDDIWEIDLTKRFALYKRWLARYKEILTKKLEVLVKKYTAAENKKNEIAGEENLALLKRAKVIGMTTTGAATHRAVLQSLGCRIIVVEEAAEVLESHIITALNKNCQHLILIGDHQQLRPKPAVFQLAKDFGLEISLFERLVKKKVPHVALREQHRMRPEISKLLRHIYPDLKDHSSVLEYNHVRGITKDIFFIDHRSTESKLDDNRSKSNDFEAEYVVALCKYLLLQGYDQSQITILTTYTGQVFAIKKIMHDARMGMCVSVTAVDHFQGEENDIILLSLVRSNEENNVGFVKVDNRVCVALSRAKVGLYVVGNFELMATQSKLWTAIIKTCQEEEIISESLTVACPNHPDTKQVISSISDFKKCPEGGCGLPCRFKLNCGHVCTLQCHGYDQTHEKFICKKSCTKTCPEKHPCKKKCSEPCGACRVLVQKEIPYCGHLDSVPCHLPPSDAKCSKTCLVELECGHRCSSTCGVCTETGKHKICSEKIEKALPCGHKSTVECSKDPSQISCKVKCGSLLICGHTCKGTCSDCLEGAIHVACPEKCRRLLPCGHECSYVCGVPCLPCSEPCVGECRHAHCGGEKKPPHFCSLPCPPCKKKCSYKCSHRKCSKFCGEFCDFEICNKKCLRKINKKNNLQDKERKKCGHICSGVCGELCVCATCEEICQIRQKNGEAKTLTDNGCVMDNLGNEKENHRPVFKIPSCSHIFYVDELDEYVRNFDPNGTRYILCPECSKPIMKCMRYEKINKKRSEMRDKEKAMLLASSQCSHIDQAKLSASSEKIRQYSFLQDFHNVRVTGLSNRVEVQAVSFKLKCSFVLNEIHSFDHGSALELEKIRNALLKIRTNVSQQQKCDYTIELLQLLMLTCLGELHLPEELLKQFDKVTNDLSHPRTDLSMMGEAHRLIMSPEESRNGYPYSYTGSSLIKDMYRRCLRIIFSSDDEMLCDILSDDSQNTEGIEELSFLHLMQDFLTRDKKDISHSHCYQLPEISRPCEESSVELSSNIPKPATNEATGPSLGHLSKPYLNKTAGPHSGHDRKPGQNKTACPSSGHDRKPGQNKTAHPSSGHDRKPGQNKTAGPSSGHDRKPGQNKTAGPSSGHDRKPDLNKTAGPSSGHDRKPGQNKTACPSSGHDRKPGQNKTAGPSSGHDRKPGQNKTAGPSSGHDRKPGQNKTACPSSGHDRKPVQNKNTRPSSGHDRKPGQNKTTRPPSGHDRKQTPNETESAPSGHSLK